MTARAGECCGTPNGTRFLDGIGRGRPTSFAPRRGSGYSLSLLRRYVPSRVRPVEEAMS
jgi:hypothetical protein